MEQQVSTGTSVSDSGASSSSSYMQQMVGSSAASMLDAGSDTTESIQPQVPQETAPGETMPEPAVTPEPEALEQPTAVDALTPDVTAFPEDVVAAKQLELAKKFGWENNPIYNAALKKMAHAELQLERVQAENSKLRAKVTQPSDGLTEYERRVLGLQPQTQQPQQMPQAPQPVQPQVQQPVQPPTPGVTRYGDIGDNWQTVDDAIKAEQLAWESGDPRKVAEVKNAVFLRQFDSQMGIIKRIAQAEARILLQQQLGDLIPSVRQSVETQRNESVKGFAIAELRKTPGFEDVDKMFQPTEGEKVQFGGQEYDNTPISQVLAENPEILDIRVQHPDPLEAQRLSAIRRLKAAAKIWHSKQAGINPTTAKQLVNAGAEMAARQAGEAARQSMNAGPTATGLGQKANDTYIQSIVKLPGSMTVADLLR